MAAPAPPWNEELPAEVRLRPEPEIMRGQVLRRLEAANLTLHSAWTFDVSEVFMEADELCKRLRVGTSTGSFSEGDGAVGASRGGALGSSVRLGARGRGRSGGFQLEIEGEHDVFGDGRVTCIPTYGHTAGHQSLRVRLDSGDVVLTGDACYLRRTLEELALPLLIHDRAEMLASLERLRRLRDRGARLLFGHDPAQ